MLHGGEAKEQALALEERVRVVLIEEIGWICLIATNL